MSRKRAPLAIFTAACAATITLASSQAHAAQRTHVSAGFGLDSNTATNCTAAAPCRFFQAAMSVTDTNGEVIVLDSGGYGAVTITQSVALIAPTGVYAGISVFSGADGVTIATPGVNVVLRGLSINGQGGNNGINMTAGNSLTVENSVISNLTQSGIVVNASTFVNVTDTIARLNGVNGILLQNGVRATITRALVSGNTSTGILVQGDGVSTTTADIADSTIDGNGKGVAAISPTAAALVKVSVRDSRVVRNATFGLVAERVTGPVSLSASNNIVSNNRFGITANYDGAKVWASGNTVSDNSDSGLSNSNGALFESAGNNAVRNNGTDVSGIVTVVSTR